MNRRLIQTPGFARDLRRWLKTHPESAEPIRAALGRLAADAADPLLRTHKLKGSLAGCWACSAGYDVRIVFEFTAADGAEAIALLALGTHDQVY